MVIARVSCRIRLVSSVFHHRIQSAQVSCCSPNHNLQSPRLMSYGEQAVSSSCNQLSKNSRLCKCLRISRTSMTHSQAFASTFSVATDGEDCHQLSESQVRRKTCCISEAGSNEFVVRVVSYNLLAQHQIDKNDYLYLHCTGEVLQWERRRDLLFKEMESFACDIMCLQEVQDDHYEEALKPFFDQLGYESHFKKKTRHGHDGVAVIFRRERFDLLAVELLEYYRAGHPVLRADNVGVVMLLQPRDPQAPGPLCVANTHLYFNANRGDVKLAQLALLLASVERMSRRPDSGHHPVLLCGDLNSEPSSPLYRFLVSGRLPNFTSLRKSDVSDQNESAFWTPPTEQRLAPGDLPPPGVDLGCCFHDGQTEEMKETGDGKKREGQKYVLEHLLHLASVYPVEDVERSERRVTSFTTHDVCCVDHMLYTPSRLRLLAYCDTVQRAEFERVAGIPNTFHGSDHIPLIADFALIPESVENGPDVAASRL